MDQKFALITDRNTFTTDKGLRIITYSSAWDNMGWTALKELSQQGAERIAESLASEGYVIVRSETQLKAAMAEAQQIAIRAR